MSMLAQRAPDLRGAQASNDESPERPIKVMIVDDSAVARGLVSRWIEAELGLEVVARHPHGKAAVESIAASAPDIVLLDIEIPVMDGLEALPLLLKARPGVRVLIASTLTRRSAEISFRALSLGAIDYVPKPGCNRELTLSTDFRAELIRKLKGLGRRAKPAGIAAADGLAPGQTPLATGVKLRPFSLVPPRILAIGSSTGGPQALAAMLPPLAGALQRIPVVIAQHMPPVFTAVLAARLRQATGLDAREAGDGEPLQPATLYVAPGDRHLEIGSAGDAPVLRLTDHPPMHFCKPAVDPLFRSVAAAFGPAALGVVLTGMGSDGAAGAHAIAEAGGSVIAQDEASSVVWGMPGAAASTGACSALLPPAAMAGAIAKLLSGVRP
jgi:two-component system chemotaxis response regulator CheB